MTLIKTRKDDNGNREYKQRALFDVKTIALIISLLGGGAGINLATNGSDTKIELLEQKLEFYQQKQKEQDALKATMLEKDLKYIKNELESIKQMIKELK